MRLIRSAHELAAAAGRLKRRGRRIGLVPTMGCLHQGHASLIRRAAADNDAVIVTIFVNPLQFGPQEDFRRYPRRFRQDCAIARQAGADMIFAPSVAELYPPGFQTAVQVGPLAARWEGQRRPGHFQGVATVVTILFGLALPTRAYFGQKDYQQTLVVRQLVRDLRLPLAIRQLPTIREADGLAMSSRNVYLTPRQRARAPALYAALRVARARIAAGQRQAEPILGAMRRRLRQAGLRVDYVAIVDANTLEPRTRLRGRVAVLGAAWIGRTRLIDNLLVGVS